MEDKGMTKDEYDTVKQSPAAVWTHAKQLEQHLLELANVLPQQPERAGFAAERWLQLAESIVGQVASLGEQTSPLLDHWVIQPLDPAPVSGGLIEVSIPDALKTMLRKEQEQRDIKLSEEIQEHEMDIALATLREQQSQTQEAIERILQEVNNSDTIQSILKKQRLIDRSAASTTKKAENTNGLPLLRMLVQNDRKGVRLEE